MKNYIDSCLYGGGPRRHALDGYTILDCTPPKMILQSGVFSKRMRFAMAHELGHILIPWHNGKTTFADRKNSAALIDRNEVEADAFLL